MPPKTKEPSEADIIFNRANVALAKSQRLIASWLPPKTPEELANAKSEEELEQEERELFAPIPELLGVGATPPKESTDGMLRRKDTSSLDALRKQLLGKHVASRIQPQSKSRSTLSTVARPTAGKSAQPDSSDEEERGRSAVFTSKKRTGKPQNEGIRADEESGAKQDKVSDSEGDSSDDQGAAEQIPSSKPGTQSHSKRKGSSFLDELLAEKSKKKKRKRKKH